MGDHLADRDRQVRAAYDEVAAEYAEQFSTADVLETEISYVSALRDIGGDASSWLLDVGCGPAIYLPIARRLGLRYVGADFSEGMLRVARGKFSDANLFLADARHLPVAACSVDLTVAMGSLSHINSDEFATAMRGMARVLRPGGAMLLGDQLGRLPFKAPYPLAGSRSIWVFLRSRDWYLKEVSRAGFSVVEVATRAPLEGEYQTEKILVWARRDPR